MDSQGDINKRQKEFYKSFDKNFATKFWFSLRNGILTRFRKSMNVEKYILDQHVEWIGNLQDKKVLDLGCYAGNSLSYYLAKNSKEYLAIDLSESAIANLNRRIAEIPNARAEAVDFLSEEFKENDFDLIYAYGVLHHFQDVDELIGRLKLKLSKKGKIISYDPTSTSKPVWIIRKLYRPFQSDRDWEWPFTRKTISKFSNAFTILDRRGILGKSKWFFLLNFIPISPERRSKIGRRWLNQDWNKSRTSNKAFLLCMQITLYMENK